MEALNRWKPIVEAVIVVDPCVGLARQRAVDDDGTGDVLTGDAEVERLSRIVQFIDGLNLSGAHGAAEARDAVGSFHVDLLATLSQEAPPGRVARNRVGSIRSICYACRRAGCGDECDGGG
ncbi:hypothetical protein ACFVJ4_41665 [Streptomyces sp. NPDC127178]|uniref:hypothetical protein n=1 Tax=unclassified Streptomyces TaxID=2593676 RepID=UPI003644402D